MVGENLAICLPQMARNALKFSMGGERFRILYACMQSYKPAQNHPMPKGDKIIMHCLEINNWPGQESESI